MRHLINVSLVFSLFLLSGCATTLTGAQHCALVGEVRDTGDKSASIKSGDKNQELQLQVSGQSSFTAGGFGAFACRPPETDEERAMVENTRPEAERIKTNNAIKLWGGTIGATVLTLGALLLFMPSYDYSR